MSGVPEKDSMMRAWHDFLDSLDSDGGKIMLLMLLMVGGVVGAYFGIPKAEDIIVGAFGALLIALKDSGSNKDRREGSPMPLPTSAGAAPTSTLPTQTAAAVAAANAPLVEAVGEVAEAIEDNKK